MHASPRWGPPRFSSRLVFVTRSHTQRVQVVAEKNRTACETQAACPFHFASWFLRSEFLRWSREKTSWTIRVSQGAPVSFPNTARWKDPQNLLADSTAKRFAALLQVRIAEVGTGAERIFVMVVWEISKSLPGSVYPIPAKLTRAARWLFCTLVWGGRAAHIFFACVTVRLGRCVCSLSTTEWLTITQVVEHIKKGRLNTSLVRRSLVHAPTGVKEGSAKVKHEGEHDAFVGELRNLYVAVARNLSL